jgi:hypothetical protein
MKQIRITEISGGTFPISVYMSDIYGNNEFFLGEINSGPVPPVVQFNTVIPSIFATAPEILLRLVDGNNCQVIKILDCVFGCAFQITIQLASCVVDMIITES